MSGAAIDHGLARAFSRLGWIGFWLQIGIGAIPIILVIYAALFGRSDGVGTRGGFALVGYLTIASLLVLGFTTVWFYRYTRLAKRMADPDRRPSIASLQRAAWTGAAGSTVGIVFSALVLMFGWSSCCCTSCARRRPASQSSRRRAAARRAGCRPATW